jgi:uncharacterized protein
MLIEVKIFIDADHLVGSTLLHEYLLRYLMHNGIGGATVFAGIMGYGSHHHIHEPKRIAASDRVPVMLVFVDESDRIRSILPHIREIMPGGLIVAHEVERL